MRCSAWTPSRGEPENSIRAADARNDHRRAGHPRPGANNLGATSLSAGGRERRQAQAVELDDLDAVGVGECDLVGGVDPQLVLAEAHLERIEREQAAREGVAETEDDLDRLDGL